MALRLSKCLGRSPESWLAMQDQYDLWHAKKKVNLKNITLYHDLDNSWQSYGTTSIGGNSNTVVINNVVFT